MKLLGIEPTPNPHSMKLTVDERLAPGVRVTYRDADRDADREDAAPVPAPLGAVLALAGVASVFRTADFVAVQREPDADWADILPAVRAAFDRHARDSGGAGGTSGAPTGSVIGDRATGDDATRGGLAAQEVQVRVQYFRRLPMLVHAVGGDQQERLSPGKRFAAAVERAIPAASNMLAERRWLEYGKRYGSAGDVARQVVRELQALYPRDRLARLLDRALDGSWEQPEPRPSRDELVALLDSSNWRDRFRALEGLGPAPELAATFAGLTRDASMPVRRQAVVNLGLIDQTEGEGTVDEEVVAAALIAALQDASPAVRRTAGDALTDRAVAAAVPAMTAALGDPSALVRWRAARFLYELGDDSALPALRAAAEDAAFEVRMQAEQAIERIVGGARAEGPAWQRMTRGRTGNDQPND